MSLVVAKRNGNLISIVSDTKLSYPIESFPNYKLAEPDKGVIKSVILNPFICVSFACNDINNAVEALRKCRLFGTNVSTLLNYLFSFHRQKRNSIDFIVGISMPSLTKIFEIKSGVKIEKNSCWIGSLDGFNCFQEKVYDYKRDFNKSETDIPDYSRCLTQVIESGVDETINGFPISVTNQNGIFQYITSMSAVMGLAPKTYTFNDALPHQIGDTFGYSIPLDIHDSTQEGNYTICIYESNLDYTAVGLFILQGNFGVVYSLGDDKSLLIPRVYGKHDEFEFEEVLKQFGIPKSFSVSSKQKSLLNRGDKSFQVGNFEEAIRFYDKGLLENEEVAKGLLFFHKGVAYLNLRNVQEALTQFQLAIKKQPNLTSAIQKILFDLKNRNSNK